VCLSFDAGGSTEVEVGVFFVRFEVLDKASNV